MAGIRFDRQIHLNLASHVPTEVHFTQSLGLIGKMQDDGAGEFVVGHAGAVCGLEDVDTVPFAGVFGAGGDAY